MGVKISEFGTAPDGSKISKYVIENNRGMKAEVINYGAILTNLWVPDSKGKIDDVVLGYDELDSYFENGSFFGATVGPNANRIANASFEINGKKVQLDVNDGPNNLHSHFKLGYHKRVFDAKNTDNSVTFSLKDEAGNMGFPGNKDVSVTYTLTNDNELKIQYEVSSDEDTVINMTNHSYFNLCGHDSGRIENHSVFINASKYTPVVAGAIPIGEHVTVKDTPFDFLAHHKVGERINDDCEQLKLVKGYDHNFVIDTPAGVLRKIAEVRAEGTDRVMEVFSDLPAVQFYAGNCIAKTMGKDGTEYGPRCGLCLETQYAPDTANHPEWPSAIYGPNRKYKSVTIYKFN